MTGATGKEREGVIPVRGNHICKDSEDRRQMAPPRTGGRSQKAESKGEVLPTERREAGRSLTVQRLSTCGAGEGNGRVCWVFFCQSTCCFHVEKKLTPGKQDIGETGISLPAGPPL